MYIQIKQYVKRTMVNHAAKMECHQAHIFECRATIDLLVHVCMLSIIQLHEVPNLSREL